MSLKFIKDKEYLFCEYRPEDGIEYIISKIRNQDTYRVKNIFTIFSFFEKPKETKKFRSHIKCTNKTRR